MMAAAIGSDDELDQVVRLKRSLVVAVVKQILRTISVTRLKGSGGPTTGFC